MTDRPKPDRSKPRRGDGTYKYQTAKGTKWGYVIDVGRKPDGARDQRRRQGFGTKAAAKEARAAEVTKRREGAWIEPSRETVGDYLDRWLEAVAPSIAPATVRSYATSLALLRGRLGGRRLSGLSVLDVQGAMAELTAAGYAPRTVRLAHRVLSIALNRAVAWGLLARNPAKSAALPAEPAGGPK
ncbi:MAG: hypothetical protein M3Q10_18365, partial [Chloroflexota bacterium]|nr:hypothetical protein [Chloroflexota bacterium]